MIKTPSDKQVALADWIADILGIDFPQSAKDFTAKTYWDFCHKYYSEAYNVTHIDDYIDPENYYYMCQNDGWCEFY